MHPLAFCLSQLSLGEVRQFEVFEEQIDKLVAAQHETEGIFTVPFAWPGRLSAAFARARKHVAFDKLLVAGKHHIAGSALSAEARLSHPVQRDADFAAFQ